MYTDDSGSSGFGPEDFDAIDDRASSGEGGRRWRGFWREVSLLGRMARSVAKGEYHLATPQMFALFGSLAYVVSPVDAIPDPVVLIGLTDDAAVVAGTVSLMAVEMAMYRDWEMSQQAAAA